MLFKKNEMVVLVFLSLFQVSSLIPKPRGPEKVWKSGLASFSDVYPYPLLQLSSPAVSQPR